MADRTTAILTSFNGGEISPRLFGRPDQSIYQISCETMLGWLPLLQGPAAAAPGTLFVAKAAGPCRLLPFEYNVTQGYVCEFSNLKIRFYTNDARIETAPDTAYEIASPYSLAQARVLDYQQSADVLYLFGGGVAPRKLERTAAEAFSIAALDLKNGPIGDGNNDDTLTLSVSGTSGSVTLTASAPLFAAGDIGRFVELEAADYNDVPSWEPGITITVGEKRTWAGKVFECAGGGGVPPLRTGTVAPEHDSGTEWDGSGTGTDINTKGPYGVRWTFLYGRHGLLKITGYTSPTAVTATVVKPLADSLVGTPSWRWALGAFSDTSGWPDAGCVWGDCLVLAKDNDVFVSVIGDLENFERRDSSGDFQRDLAGRFRLPGTAKVKWVTADGMLLVGTEKREHPVERVLTNTGQAGPPVFELKRPSSSGSAPGKPVDADGRVLFVQRAGRKLMELGYDLNTDRYQAPDLTRLAEHIGLTGFSDLAWAQEPERLLWTVRGDGSLAALAYAPAEQVKGWARRSLGTGLAATSLCRITDPQGKRDQIWISASKGPETWVLRMTKIWETGDDPTEAVYVDAGGQYEGAAATVISGLAHLNGETVQVLADGKPHPDRQVSGGAITLAYPARKVTAGLAFPAVLKPLKIEAGQSEGTAQTKKQRIIELRVRVIETQGISVSVSDGAQIPVETRLAGDPMDEAVPLYTGDLVVTTVGTYERGGTLTIERTQATPATVCAIVPVLETGEI